MRSRSLRPSSSFSTSSRARLRLSSFFLSLSSSIVLLEQRTNVADVRSYLDERTHDKDRFLPFDRPLRFCAAPKKHIVIVAVYTGACKVIQAALATKIMSSPSPYGRRSNQP